MMRAMKDMSPGGIPGESPPASAEKVRRPDADAPAPKTSPQERRAKWKEVVCAVAVVFVNALTLIQNVTVTVAGQDEAHRAAEKGVARGISAQGRDVAPAEDLEGRGRRGRHKHAGQVGGKAL